ncbi:MAG: hypothetical protein V1743_07925 [Nanoarchaeota archaeon]
MKKHHRNMVYVSIIAIIVILAVVLLIAVLGNSIGQATRPMTIAEGGSGGSPLVLKGNPPLAPQPVCGDLVCAGGEIVTCEADCAFTNVKNDNVVIYDLVYDAVYPGTLRFKVWNFGDPIPLNDVHMAFSGNGESCRFQGRGYIRAMAVEQGYIPHHNSIGDYVQLTVQGSMGGPPLASARHCNNPIRLGLYRGNAACGEEQYAAIVNTVLKCIYSA